MTSSLLTIIDSFQHVISGFTPAVAGTIKISAQSIGWIGGLTVFILWKSSHVAK